MEKNIKNKEFDILNYNFDKLSLKDKTVNNKISSNNIENNETFENDESRINTELIYFASSKKIKDNKKTLNEKQFDSDGFEIISKKKTNMDKKMSNKITNNNQSSNNHSNYLN